MKIFTLEEWTEKNQDLIYDLLPVSVNCEKCNGHGRFELYTVDGDSVCEYDVDIDLECPACDGQGGVEVEHIWELDDSEKAIILREQYQKQLKRDLTGLYDAGRLDLIGRAGYDVEIDIENKINFTER